MHTLLLHCFRACDFWVYYGQNSAGYEKKSRRNKSRIMLSKLLSRFKIKKDILLSNCRCVVGLSSAPRVVLARRNTFCVILLPSEDKQEKKHQENEKGVSQGNWTLLGGQSCCSMGLGSLSAHRPTPLLRLYICLELPKGTTPLDKQTPSVLWIPAVTPAIPALLMPAGTTMGPFGGVLLNAERQLSSLGPDSCSQALQWKIHYCFLVLNS